MSTKLLSESIKDALEYLAIHSVKKPLFVFFISAVLAVFAVIGAMNVQMEMGMDLYLDENSGTLQDWSSLKSDFGKGNAVFVVIETNDSFDLYEPQNSRLISDLYLDIYERVPDVSLVTSFAHPIKAGIGRGEIPDTRKDVLRSVELTQKEHRTNEKVIYNLHPGARDGSLEDNNIAVVQIQYGEVNLPDDVEGSLAGFVPPDANDYIRGLVQGVVDVNSISDNAKVTVTGSPVFESVAFGLMLPEILLLFSLAFAVIVLTLFLIIKSSLQKWYQIIFPLGTVLLAVLLMVGSMSVLGFNFNAIMLGVMPVALGLGIDYALQIQSRYLDERRKGRSIDQSAVIASRNDGYALLIAFSTTVIGLLSLLVALVPPVRQFGITAAISVMASMVLSLTLLVSLITYFDVGFKPASYKRDKESKRKSMSSFDSIFGKLSDLIFDKATLVLSFGALLFLVGIFSYVNVQTQTDMLDYWPQIQERQDIRDLQDMVAAPNILYVVVEHDDIHHDYDALVKISEFEHALESVEFVVTPISPVRAVEMTSEEGTIDELNKSALFERLEKRVSVDRPPVASQPYENHPNQFITQVYVEDVSGDEERQVIDDISAVAGENLGVMGYYVSGNLVVNRNVIENVTAGLTSTTLVSFSIGLVALSFFLWSFKDAFVLIMGVSAGSVLFATTGMLIFGIPWNPLTVTTASIILGIGIDYAVHLFERFKEELNSGSAAKRSLSKAMEAKSIPILASGITTLLGFGVLAFSDFPVLYEFGFAVVFAMLGSLILSFILLPALLSKLYCKPSYPKHYFFS